MPFDKITAAVTPADVSVATDVAGLARLKSAARERTPEALEAVAKQFESLFLEMMLKSMREAKLGEGMFDSDAGELYQGMFDKQIALDLSGLTPCPSWLMILGQPRLTEMSASGFLGQSRACDGRRSNDPPRPLVWRAAVPAPAGVDLAGRPHVVARRRRQRSHLLAAARRSASTAPVS